MHHTGNRGDKSLSGGFDSIIEHRSNRIMENMKQLNYFRIELMKEPGNALSTLAEDISNMPSKLNYFRIELMKELGNVLSTLAEDISKMPSTLEAAIKNAVHEMWVHIIQYLVRDYPSLAKIGNNMDEIRDKIGLAIISKEKSLDDRMIFSLVIGFGIGSSISALGQKPVSLEEFLHLFGHHIGNHGYKSCSMGFNSIELLSNRTNERSQQHAINLGSRYQAHGI